LRASPSPTRPSLWTNSTGAPAALLLVGRAAAAAWRRCVADAAWPPPRGKKAGAAQETASRLAASRGSVFSTLLPAGRAWRCAPERRVLRRSGPSGGGKKQWSGFSPSRLLRLSLAANASRLDGWALRYAPLFGLNVVRPACSLARSPEALSSDWHLSLRCSLITDFYEYGWGHSFHFAPRNRGESFDVRPAGSQSFACQSCSPALLHRTPSSATR
jgi:hypothetical protein